MRRAAAAAPGRRRPRCRAARASAVGEHRPVERREPLDVGGPPLRVHAERVEESAQHVPQVGGQLVGGVETAQVRVELPVGERCATRCAQCSASAVFPTPAVPPIAEITTPVAPTAWSDAAASRTPSSSASSSGPPREVRHPRRQLPRHGHAPGSSSGSSVYSTGTSSSQLVPRARAVCASASRCRRRPGTARQGPSRPPPAGQAPAQAPARTTDKASVSARAQGRRWRARTRRTAPPGLPGSAQQRPAAVAAIHPGASDRDVHP